MSTPTIVIARKETVPDYLERGPWYWFATDEVGVTLADGWGPTERDALAAGEATARALYACAAADAAAGPRPDPRGIDPCACNPIDGPCCAAHAGVGP